MIDIKLIMDDAHSVKERLKERLSSPELIDKIHNLYSEKASIQHEADELRHQKKSVSKEIGIAKSKGGDADELLKQSDALSEKLLKMEEKEKSLTEEVNAILYLIPNLPAEDTPRGKDENQNVEIKRWGTPRKFDFTPLPHYEIAEKLGILDFERGSKISGSGFTLYHDLGAKLERALINFMLDTHTANGYSEKFLPFLVSDVSLTGTGQLPKFKEDLYRIDGESLYLNPTAEVALTNIYRDEVISESSLPISVTAYSPSFRKEAGSYGKDTRGIIRQHQFNKVELVKFALPEDSEKSHQAMLADAEKILQLLGLPYRVIVLCSGDMGFGASKCYDIEVWLPSLNAYKEISSVSNCRDFQARRANIKFKRESTKKNEFVHTLNGSGLAVGRTVVAILENFQQKDGSIAIPEVLQKYMNNLQFIK